MKCEGLGGFGTARRDKCKKFIPIPCGNLVILTQNFYFWQELYNYRGEAGFSLSVSPVSTDSHLGFKKSHRHICSIPHSGYSYTLIRNVSREDIDIVHYRVLVKALRNVISRCWRERENPLESIQNKTECCVARWRTARIMRVRALSCLHSRTVASTKRSYFHLNFINISLKINSGK